MTHHNKKGLSSIYGDCKMNIHPEKNEIVFNSPHGYLQNKMYYIIKPKIIKLLKKNKKWKTFVTLCLAMISEL